MKCKEILVVAKNEKIIDPNLSAHIETCAKCRELLILDSLAPAIIRAASKTNYEAPPTAAIVMRIRDRVQEMREQHSSSWESAVESTRGWLAAFALTAVILIAAAIQWQPLVITSDIDHDGDEQTTQNPAEYLITDVPDPVGAAQFGKDNSYAHR